MKVGAITSPRVAGKRRITSSPAGAGFVVAHPPEHVIVERFGALDLIGFSDDRLLRNCFEGLVERHQLFRPEIARHIRFTRNVSALLFSQYAITQLDDFAAVLRARIKHTNIVTVIAVMHFLLFDRDADLIDTHVLKSVRSCERHPKARLAIDRRQLYPIDKFKLVGAGNDLRLITAKDWHRSNKSECQRQRKMNHVRSLSLRF